jgi:hypothetical protein
LGGTEWQHLADPVSLLNVHLSNINVYAAHKYDRQHILDINMERDLLIEKFVPSVIDADIIDEWTIDRDTAFEIGWDSTIVNIVHELCEKQLNQSRKADYRITSIRFPIIQETQELTYFPVYVVDYEYSRQQKQCLINARTGQVAGSREFSQTKVGHTIIVLRTHSLNR